jgi:hypothetical protein
VEVAKKWKIRSARRIGGGQCTGSGTQVLSMSSSMEIEQLSCSSTSIQTSGTDDSKGQEF